MARWTWIVSAAAAAMAMGIWWSAGESPAAGAAAAPAAQPAKAGANLVQNPSFEDRSGPAQDDEPWGIGSLDGVARGPFSHWGYSGFWDNGDYHIKVGAGHTGKNCVRLVCHAKGRGGIATEAIEVRPGTRLQFKGWFKAIGAQRGSCVVNFEGDPGDGWAQIALPAKADYDWTEITGEVTVPAPRKPAVAGAAPAAQSEKVAIHVFVYIQAYGELWIDDISLCPLVE